SNVSTPVSFRTIKVAAKTAARRAPTLKSSLISAPPHHLANQGWCDALQRRQPAGLAHKDLVAVACQPRDDLRGRLIGRDLVPAPAGSHRRVDQRENDFNDAHAATLRLIAQALREGMQSRLRSAIHG